MARDDSSDEDGIDRRSYLQGVAATGTLSALGLGAGTGTAAAADHQPEYSKRRRRELAQEHRRTAMRDLVSPYNSPLSRIEPESQDPIEVDGEYIDVFSKGMPGVGSVDAQFYDEKIVAPITDPNVSFEDFYEPETSEYGPYTTSRQFVSPHVAVHFPNDGMDSWMATMPKPPAYDSPRTAAELIDCYWMSQLRDVDFADITNDDRYAGGSRSYENDAARIRSAVSEDLPWFDESTPFRGSFPGSKQGPYLSQFYTHPADLGNLRIEPTIRPFSDDYLTGGPAKPGLGRDFREVQTGHLAGSAEPGGVPKNTVNDREQVWISNGRELASLVRDEISVQHYVMAAAQLFGWGASFDDGLPFTDHNGILPYARYGGGGTIDALTRAAHNAIAAAWYYKWAVHRRLRPETYGAHISDLGNSHRWRDRIPNLILDSDAVAEVHANEDYHYYPSGRARSKAKPKLLPQAYPEGSPQHPAYPSGHSVLAGAAVTVLKTIFKDEPLADLFSSDDGPTFRRPPRGNESEPQPYNGDDAGDLTVHSELNKLADNVGVARIWAGVHYWSDHTYGAKLGEQMAVATMLDIFKEEYGGSGNSVNPRFTPLDPSSVSTDSDGQVELSIDTLEQLRQANTTR